MGEVSVNRRRLLPVTPGNVKNSHIYISAHYDFFPPECVGGPKRSKDQVGVIEIFLEGINETVMTDIGTDAKTGRPRGFLRGRGWVRRFHQYHKVKPGMTLALDRIARRAYRLSVAGSADRSLPTLRAAEFFAGIGLVRLALERQGWNVVYANDIDPKKAEMYRAKWPEDDHLVVGDIHKIDPQSVPDCELFTASFPCNDLSIAGKWEGLNGKESSAFWGLIRILQEMGDRRPACVLLENVVGFLMSHGGRDFEQALLALNKLGYLVDAVILNAVHWTPQSRARMFVVAKRDEGQARRGAAMMTDARPEALFRFIHSHPDIAWDLSDVPPLPRPTARLADIVEDLPDNDPHWWSKDRVDYFMNQLSPRHEAEARRMIDGKAVSYATAFRRVRHGKSMAELRTDGIAGCLRTPRGGSGRQILFKAGGGRHQVRLLTARECARLQGVPDDYPIRTPLNQALFGFGDAVCVPAVEWVVKYCILGVKTLNLAHR